MSIASLLKHLTKALPAVLAAAPTVIDAVKQVGQALKKPKKPARTGGDATAAAGPAPASERLNADSGRGAR